MTKQEVRLLVRQLELVFEIVRLVDVSLTTQFLIDEAGEMIKQPYQCYAVWNKSGRCENCISAKAFAHKCKMTKFEFVDDNAYFVVSAYIEVNEVPYMLEMVSKLTDETLFGAFGKNDFIQTITNFNKKLYVDPLTGAYNRHYYEEQLRSLTGTDAVAMLDVDDFKDVNDNFGHQAGDMALKKIVEAIISCIRNTDAVIRYGGDEFLIVFREIPREVFAERLEKIRKLISEIQFGDQENLRLSVSIGGAYCCDEEESAIGAADRMLYKAKSFKNSVQLA